MLDEPTTGRSDKYVASRGENKFTQTRKPNTTTGGVGPFRSNRQPVIVEKNVPIFNIDQHLFPTLGNNLASKQQTDTVKDFKSIVNTVIEKPLDQENSIKPGWVEVTGVKGKTAYKYRYGEKTEYQKKMEERDEIEATPNYIMNAAINSIAKQRERHITEYNDIHGNGEYEDKYIMSPCYGSEYDTDEDADDGENDHEEDYEWY